MGTKAQRGGKPERYGGGKHKTGCHICGGYPNSPRIARNILYQCGQCGFYTCDQHVTMRMLQKTCPHCGSTSLKTALTREILKTKAGGLPLKTQRKREVQQDLSRQGGGGSLGAGSVGSMKGSGGAAGEGGSAPSVPGGGPQDPQVPTGRWGKMVDRLTGHNKEEEDPTGKYAPGQGFAFAPGECPGEGEDGDEEAGGTKGRNKGKGGAGEGEEGLKARLAEKGEGDLAIDLSEGEEGKGGITISGTMGGRSGGGAGDEEDEEKGAHGKRKKRDDAPQVHQLEEIKMESRTGSMHIEVTQEGLGGGRFGGSAPGAGDDTPADNPSSPVSQGEMGEERGKTDDPLSPLEENDPDRLKSIKGVTGDEEGEETGEGAVQQGSGGEHEEPESELMAGILGMEEGEVWNIPDPAAPIFEALEASLRIYKEYPTREARPGFLDVLVPDACYIISDAAGLTQFADRAQALEKESPTANVVTLDMNTAESGRAYMRLLRNENARVLGIVGCDPRRVLPPDEEESDAAATVCSPSALEQIIRCLPGIIGVGVAGLDMKYAPYTIDIQKESLLEQIKIAEKYNLPLLLTERGAEEELMEFLEEHPIRNTSVVMVSPPTLEKSLEICLRNNFYVLLRPEFTYEESEAYRQNIRKIPPERWLLATGSEQNAPKSKRGGWNRPEYLPELISALKKEFRADEHDILKQVTENFLRVFRPGASKAGRHEEAENTSPPSVEISGEET